MTASVGTDIDPETELPHIYRQGVAEPDVEDVLRRPMEDRPDEKGIIAYRLGAKAPTALRRRRRRRR